MKETATIEIASGVDDGSIIKCSVMDGYGEESEEGDWILKIGRHDGNDIILNNDTFISRYHAQLRIQENQWWLEDLQSTNGTYIEIRDEVEPVHGVVQLMSGQYFRIGRTWLCLMEG